MVPREAPNRAAAIPATQPVFPFTTSARSGFRFCGISEEPVT